MIIAILFILLITFGIGLPLVLLIVSRANLFIKLGLSFPIGIGFFTLLMFGSNLLGLKFTLLDESLLLLATSIPLTLIQLGKLKALFNEVKVSIKNIKFDLTEKIMLGIIIFLVVASFINTFYWPVYMWDSVVLYDFRGHVFASTGFMKDAFINAYYYGYPLLTSLAHTIVYLCGGKYPQFIYSIFYLSLGVSFYGLIKEFVSRKLSLFASLLLLMTGPLFYHSLYSYTNLTYTVYLSLGAILIYFWSSKLTLRDRKGDIGYLILSALLIGFSIHVRATEPFWLAAILIVIIVSIIKKKYLYAFIYPLVVLPIRQIWVSYQGFVSAGSATNITNKMGIDTLLPELINWNRWDQIIGFLYKYLVLPQWPLFALFFLSGVILMLKKQKEQLLMFVITILFVAVLIAGTFIFSIYLDYWNRIGDATERLSMIFYPLLVYSSALLLYDLGRKQR